MSKYLLDYRVMPLDFDPIAEAGANWRARGWHEVEAMMAATSITRAHQILLGRIDAALAPLGLNFSRFEVLALLGFTRVGELPMGKIGDRLQVHPASVTNTISRLERDGLVTRVAHPTDGRTTLARLTPRGRRLADDGAERLADIEFGLAGCDGQTNGRLIELLTEFRGAAGDFAAQVDV